MDVVRSFDGKTYAVPFYQVAMALYFRKDHFLEAGLDPSNPPRTWEEFYEAGRRLTEIEKGRSGFGFSAGLGGKAYHWVNFAWQAGAEVVEPAEDGYWKSAIATPEGANALDFFRRLTLDKWVGDDGQEYGPVANVTTMLGPDIAAGKISMWFSYTNDIVLSASDINPSLIGMTAMPAGPGGSRNEINAGMWAINSSITDPKKLEACWRFIKFFSGQEAARVQTHAFVDLGLGNLVNPVLLKEYGYDDLARAVDPAYVQASEQLFVTGKPEPYGRNCQQIYTVLDSALDRAMLEPNTPAIEILTDVSAEMDRKLLGYTPAEVMKQRRTWAFGIATLFGLTALGLAWRAWSRRKLAFDGEERAMYSGERSRAFRFMGLALLPAVLSIGVWAYWPLVHGLVIAFQDYKIVKGATFCGIG